MDRYIGLDVHSQSCTVSVLSSTGKRVGLQVVETNGSALKQAIRAVHGTKHLCLEEGTQSAWMYELLQPEVDELVVTVPEKREGPKDDERDAWHLAERLRTGAVKQRVYKAHGPYSELRAAMRSYLLLRDDVTRTKNRLKAIYRSRGICPGAEAYEPKRWDDWASQLPIEQRRSAKVLLSQLESLTELWGEAAERLKQASRPHSVVKLLSTAPAIGPIRAAQIVATVVTPHRFRTSRQFWAYCGLAVVTRSSSDWTRDRHGQWIRATRAQTRGLNRNRHPMLKEVFKSAAHQIATQMTSHPLHQDYVRLTNAGAKPNLAMLTMARRIAATVLAMWKRKETYDATRHRAQVQVTAPA